MFFENELPMNHEPSLDRMAKAWATENVEEAKEEEAMGFESRNSTDFDDIFHAHIGGVDTFARALITAEKILISSEYSSLRKNRYASFDTGNGNQFEKGSLTLEALSKIAFNDSPPKRTSGKQELFENIINQFI